MKKKTNIIQKQALNAQLAINQGHIKDAANILNKLYQKHQQNELALRVCASLFGKIADWDQSIKCTRSLLKLDKSKFEYVLVLKELLTKSGRKSSIISDLKGFIKANPSDARGYLQMALAYHSEKSFNKAIKYFDKSLSSDKHCDLVECHFGLALSQIESHQESEGIKNLELCLSLDSNHRQAKFNLATLLQAKGNNRAAAELFEQLISQYPQFTEALVRRIYISKVTPESDGFLFSAKAQLKTANQFDQETLNYALGKGYDDLDNYKDAITFYREANRLNNLRIGKYNVANMKNFVDRTINTNIQELNIPIDSKISPVFIVGHFRSGSTLVEQIMSRHPQINTLGEIEFFLQFFHQNEGAYWALMNNCDKEKALQLKDNYISEISERSYSGGHFTDKRPENLAFIGLIKYLMPNAKFIVTQRNLADNALSIYFQQLNDLSRFSTSFKDIIEYDKQTNRLINHWQEKFKNDIHVISYEQLVSNYENNARALIEFVGLPWEPDCINFAESENYVRTASVGQVRQKLYTSSIGRIKNYLPHLNPIEKDLLS